VASAWCGAFHPPNSATSRSMSSKAGGDLPPPIATAALHVTRTLSRGCDIVSQQRLAQTPHLAISNTEENSSSAGVWFGLQTLGSAAHWPGGATVGRFGNSHSHAKALARSSHRTGDLPRSRVGSGGDPAQSQLPNRIMALLQHPTFAGGFTACQGQILKSFPLSGAFWRVSGPPSALTLNRARNKPRAAHTAGCLQSRR
jgi:hypothetical protein